MFLELHVSDFRPAKEFYSDLGFKIIWEEKDYLCLTKNKSFLCFYGNSEKVYKHSYFGQFSENTKKGYAAEIVVFVDDINATFAAIKDKSKVVESIYERRWGAKDFRIEDPYGFYVRVTENYDPSLAPDKRSLFK